MVATAIYSVTMVLWQEMAFPLSRAVEKRYYYYAAFSVPCVGHKDDEWQVPPGRQID